MITKPSSFLQGFFVPFTTTIFLNESGIFLNELDAAFAERVFLDELDVVFAVGQLKWAAGRVENGINAEAIHHLMKCVETCEGLSVGYPNLAVI